MGEYINHKTLGDIKLGTCENLYYTTFAQYVDALRHGLLTQLDGNDSPEDYVRPDVYRFRFPFPDENMDMGDYIDYNKGVLFRVPNTVAIELGHGNKSHRFDTKAGSYSVELPCVYSPEFPKNVKLYEDSIIKNYIQFEVIQQKLIRTEDNDGGYLQLQTVVRCPICGSMCRLSENEAYILHILADENPELFTDDQKTIIKIINSGYQKIKLPALLKNYWNLITASI